MCYHIQGFDSKISSSAQSTQSASPRADVSLPPGQLADASTLSLLHPRSQCTRVQDLLWIIVSRVDSDVLLEFSTVVLVYMLVQEKVEMVMLVMVRWL